MMITPVLLSVMTALVPFQDQERQEAKYVKKTEYPVIDEMLERNEKLRDEARKKSEEILQKIKAREKAEKEQKGELRFDTSKLKKPSGPDAFTKVWHNPPTPQYLTGTCWSFAVTSFMEAEIHRLHGKELKLSEMWTVYWEYVDKARGFVRTRGKTYLGEGSETNAFQRIWSARGVVPRSVYEGCLAEDGRFNHEGLFEHFESFLGWCKDREFWDEEFILNTVQSFLDKTLGPPPETFEWEGKPTTPRQFLEEICEVRPGDYVAVMSTMSKPFWEEGKLEAPDNWWHDASYINVPLDVWYKTLKTALSRGASVCIGGDVSEPGLYGKQDIAYVPTFDIPSEYIDQSSREFRMVNGTTTDDHAVHIVGHTQVENEDWFLIKDSNRSSRLGQYKGYYMYHGDYIRLKMLAIGVHKDMIAELKPKMSSDPE